jgi:hypothetical protein
MRLSKATMARRVAATLIVLSFLLAGTAVSENTINIKVAASSAVSYSNFRYHLFPANTDAGRSIRAASIPTRSTLSTATTVPGLPAPGFYPADLTFFHGPIVKNMVHHDVFIDCPSSCWGNPGTFLTNLGLSNFIHLTDQYVFTNTNNRYTVGLGANVNFPIITGVVGQNDLLVILHAVAKAQGKTGLGHEYHLFLPPGVDTCFDLTNICYSPDNLSSFFFCAYHGSVDFPDIGHVLLSVEPFQNASSPQAGGAKFCAVDPNHSPNGLLVDSTANVLSHEVVETITDPNPQNFPFTGAGWVAVSSLIEFGAEIGDECENAFFSYIPVALNGHKYEIQPEYSNKYHGCAFVP